MGQAGTIRENARILMIPRVGHHCFSWTAFEMAAMLSARRLEYLLKRALHHDMDYGIRGSIRSSIEPEHGFAVQQDLIIRCRSNLPSKVTDFNG